MMLTFITCAEFFVTFMVLYICQTSCVVSKYNRSEILIRFTYSYVVSTTFENSKLYQFKLDSNKIYPEEYFGKYIEKIDISVNFQNKTFKTAEKLLNIYSETKRDFNENENRNQTIGFGFRSDFEFETLQLKTKATLNKDPDADNQSLKELSIVWTKRMETDVYYYYCGKTVCENVENSFAKWLMNANVFDSLYITINQTRNNVNVTNDSLDHVNDVNLIVYLSEPLCNFEDTCTWTNNSKDFIKWRTNVDNLEENYKLPQTNITGDISGLLYIPTDDNHFSAKITSPIIVGSGNDCKLSFREVVWKRVGFIVRIMTSQTSFNVNVYKNPGSYKAKLWKPMDIFLGTLNEPFRVEIEMFVYDRLVSYVAIDDISLTNCTYIPGGLKACNNDDFQCSTGSCIQKQLTCNSQIDCLKQEDESQNLCGLHKNFSCDFESSENCTLIDTITGGRYEVISANATKTYSYQIEYLNPFMMLDHTRKSDSGKMLFIQFEKQVILKTIDLPALPENVILNKTCKIHFSFDWFNGEGFIMTIKSRLFQKGKQVYEIAESYEDKKEWTTVAFTAKNLSSISYYWEFTIIHTFMVHFYLDDIYLSPECYENDGVDITRPKNTELKIEPYIAVSLVTIAVVMFVVIFYVYKKEFARKRQRRHAVVADKNNQGQLTFTLGSSEMLHRLHNVMAERNPEYDWANTRTLSEIINTIPRSKLHIIGLIGRGQFGEVHKATLLPRSLTGKPIHVAIKKLPLNSSDQTKADFFLEAVTMSKFKHPNIVDCIGIATEQNMLFLVLEYMNGGDLKCFLRENRSLKDDTGTLTIAELTSLAVDIARGCWYLQQNKFVHRDIAARNCLVLCSGVTRVAKIADFGLARDVLTSDYYRKFGSAMLPVRWMSPEAILEGFFSTSSDVWSFGVLMWEVYSYGYMPYPGLSNTDVIGFITGGGRLSQTANCPIEIYRLMTECWNSSPSERPSFKKVLLRLEEIGKKMVDLPISPDKLEVKFSRQRLNTYESPEASPLISKTSLVGEDNASQELLN